jgi:hypothetical protein
LKLQLQEKEAQIQNDKVNFMKEKSEIVHKWKKDSKKH